MIDANIYFAEISTRVIEEGVAQIMLKKEGANDFPVEVNISTEDVVARGMRNMQYKDVCRCTILTLYIVCSGYHFIINLLIYIYMSCTYIHTCIILIN